MKLTYKKMNIAGIDLNIARTRRWSAKIMINGNNDICVIWPYIMTPEQIENFIIKNYKWIEKHIKKNANKKIINTNIRLSKENKKTLMNKLSNYINKYETLMNTKVNRFSIRKMSTRWGSCSKYDKTIRFSESLFYMSDSFIEYLVVHEMSHLFFANHSKHFYNLVSTYLPNYKEINKESKTVSLI